eukprot:302931-Pyramimonas_sp.AAC.1
MHAQVVNHAPFSDWREATATNLGRNRKCTGLDWDPATHAPRLGSNAQLDRTMPEQVGARIDVNLQEQRH